jgi:uncharacterized protein (TIGR03083 family)
MTAGERELGAMPTGLRARVLEASLRARSAGRPVPEVPEISPAEAFGRAADALDRTLSALAAGDWRRPVLRGLDVRGLVGHLIGVEHDVHRSLAGDPAVAAADHITSTQPAADGQAGQVPARTHAEWRQAADHTFGLATARDLDGEVALHGMRLPLGALLVVRAFELWTHENDIRRAAGLPASVPDPSTLRLMTGLAAHLLPQAVRKAGQAQPARVHLVLTGNGGGTWDVTVGEPGPGPASVDIVTDAVGFCQLAANRITPAELDVHVTGDRAAAARILAAAPALALD